VIQHLTKLSNTTVKITLEIHADLPSGATDDVVRTVLENCNTLKFTTKSFEQEWEDGGFYFRNYNGIDTK
jgi:hypothetical protein